MIKTLAALLVAMTLGTFALLALETAPIPPTAQDLTATATPGEDISAHGLAPDVALQMTKWRHVIIHAAPVAGDRIADNCHFLVFANADDDGRFIRATTLWKNQFSGRHVFVPGFDYNANSIGVCLIGRFTRRGPARGQFQALTGLVRTLQKTLQIPADHVFLLRDLDQRTNSPGRAFPTRAFNSHLIR